MVESSSSDAADLKKAIVGRVSLVFILPFVITAILAIMFFILSTRIRGVEVGMKVETIERILLNDKNYKGAIRQYEQIAKESRNAMIEARLGRLYFSLDPKNPKIALEHLERAKQIDASHWETYTTLVYVYVVDGRAADALREGKRALELNDLDAATYNNLAWLLATSKDPAVRNLQLAEVYAKQAVQLSREKQPAYLDTLAVVYYQKGGEANHVLALKYMRKAMTMAPRDELEGYSEHFRELFPKEKQ